MCSISQHALCSFAAAHPALADEHFLRTPAERQALAAARLVPGDHASQAPIRPQSAQAHSPACANGSHAHCSGLHPTLAEAVAAGAWSRMLPCVKPLDPAVTASSRMPALQHGQSFGGRCNEGEVAWRSRCAARAGGVASLDAPARWLASGAAGSMSAGAWAAASSACCDTSVGPTCAADLPASSAGSRPFPDGQSPAAARGCLFRPARTLGACAWLPAGPFGEVEAGAAEVMGPWQGQNNEEGTRGRLCGAATNQANQRGSGSAEGTLDCLGAASCGAARRGCAEGTLGDLCGTAAGLSGRIGELQAAVRALRLARCPGAAAGARSLADHLAAASTVRQKIVAEAHGAQRGSVLQSQPNFVGQRLWSLADHLAASASSQPCDSLADASTASQGGCVRTPAQQGVVSRRATPVSESAGGTAALQRHAKAGARFSAGGPGAGGRAGPVRPALPPVRWLSPPEPASPGAPASAACPEPRRVLAALEDVPAFLPLPVGGAAARERGAGPAGRQLSGAKRRAGAEADAAFAAFLRRSQHRMAAAEQVRQAPH